jgi:hypothetical protein
MIAESNELAQRYTLSVCALGRVALAHHEGLIPAVSRGWPCLKAVKHLTDGRRFRRCSLSSFLKAPRATRSMASSVWRGATTMCVSEGPKIPVPGVEPRLR